MTSVASTPLLNTSSNSPVYEYVDEQGNFVEYDLTRLNFCDAAEEKVPPPPGSQQKPITGFRINLQDRRADGRLQDFLFRMPENYSYGVSESLDQKSGELNGYTLPLPMWSQDGATPVQKAITDWLEGPFLDRIKKHLVEVRKTFKRPDLIESDLRKMKIFYRKKDDDGNVNPNDMPTWYPKLIVAKKKGMKIITRFYLMVQLPDTGKLVTAIDEKGEPLELDPMKLKERHGKARPVIKIESVYIGQNISVQCKVWEVDYFPTEAALPRKVPIQRLPGAVVSVDDNNPMSALLKGAAAPPPAVATSATDGGNAGSTVQTTGDITVTDPPPPAVQAPPASVVPNVRIVKVAASSAK